MREWLVLALSAEKHVRFYGRTGGEADLQRTSLICCNVRSRAAIGTRRRSGIQSQRLCLGRSSTCR